MVYLSTEAVLIGSGPLINVDERRGMNVENITGFYPKSKGIGDTVNSFFIAVYVEWVSLRVSCVFCVK